MKKFNRFLCLGLVALTAFSIVGCGSSEDAGTTKADIDQVNKGLPPSDSNPPPIPTREGGGKVGKGG